MVSDEIVALLNASRDGRVDEVRICLDRGIHVDIDDPADGLGGNALYLACRFGHADAARLLLDRGAAIDHARANGETALFGACWKNHLDAARLLLDRGADVDRRHAPHGTTPLIIACQAGNTGAVRLCLDYGADVNQTTQNLINPLFMACWGGFHDAARLCLARGADINWVTARGQTPLSIARERGHAAMAAWLGRVRAVGWTAYLSEPRYKLVVLRQLSAQGRAERRRAFSDTEHLLDFLFPGQSGEQTRANKQARRRRLRLPDELFAIVAGYYWGGEPQHLF